MTPTVISAFGRPSKGFYLDHIAKRYVENRVFLKTAVSHKKEEFAGDVTTSWTLEPDAPAKTVKETITN